MLWILQLSALSSGMGSPTLDADARVLCTSASLPWILVLAIVLASSCHHSVSLVRIPPSAESSEDSLTGSSSAASFSWTCFFLGVVPHGQWAHLNKLRFALIDRSAKLVEPSHCCGFSFASAHAPLLRTHGRQTINRGRLHDSMLRSHRLFQLPLLNCTVRLPRTPLLVRASLGRSVRSPSVLLSCFVPFVF